MQFDFFKALRGEKYLNKIKSHQFHVMSPRGQGENAISWRTLKAINSGV